MFPSTPLMSKQVWFCLGKNFKAAFQLARVVSLNDQFQQQNYNRACDIKEYCGSHQNGVGN